MKNDEQLFFKIEDYLRGNLPPEEAAAFEREIAADAELAETVKMHRFEREGLEFMIGESLRAKIKDWEKSPPAFDEPAPVPQKNYRKWWIGLLAVALLGVTVFLILKDRSTTKGNLPVRDETPLPADSLRKKTENPPVPAENSIPIAGENDKPAEKEPAGNQPQKERYRPELIAWATSAYELPSNFFPDNQRNTGGGEKSPLAPAVATFKQAKPDYKKAIAELQKINQKQYPQDYGKAQEMLAHAYFKDGQYAKAAAIFQKMTEQNLPAAEHDQAEWYLLLSLVPDYEKQKKRVGDLLEKMTAAGELHEYRKEALALLEKIKR